MKFYFVGLLILASNILFSQKTYDFDYVLEYDFQLKKGSPIKKEYFYTNSKDNSYKLHIIDVDSLNFKLDFMDFSGNHAVVNFSKADFSKAQSITIPCKFVRRYQTNKFQTKNYSFVELKDTVVEGLTYYHYVLKSNSLKRELKKKLARSHYIVDKNSSFHLPILFEDTSFEEWKAEQNIPNGIPFIQFIQSNVDKKLHLIRKLVFMESIVKQLFIPNNCDNLQIDLKAIKNK